MILSTPILSQIYNLLGLYGNDSVNFYFSISNNKNYYYLHFALTGILSEQTDCGILTFICTNQICNLPPGRKMKQHLVVTALGLRSRNKKMLFF